MKANAPLSSNRKIGPAVMRELLTISITLSSLDLQLADASDFIRGWIGGGFWVIDVGNT